MHTEQELCKQPMQGPEVTGNAGAVLKLGGALGTGCGHEQMTLDSVLKENGHFGVLCTYIQALLHEYRTFRMALAEMFSASNVLPDCTCTALYCFFYLSYWGSRSSWAAVSPAMTRGGLWGSSQNPDKDLSHGVLCELGFLPKCQTWKHSSVCVGVRWVCVMSMLAKIVMSHTV